MVWFSFEGDKTSVLSSSKDVYHIEDAMLDLLGEQYYIGWLVSTPVRRRAFDKPLKTKQKVSKDNCSEIFGQFWSKIWFISFLLTWLIDWLRLSCGDPLMHQAFLKSAHILFFLLFHCRSYFWSFYPIQLTRIFKQIIIPEMFVQCCIISSFNPPQCTCTASSSHSNVQHYCTAISTTRYVLVYAQKTTE